MTRGVDMPSTKKPKLASLGPWANLPEVLMRLVLRSLSSREWDACREVCQAWTVMGRKITWPRQLVVLGSSKVSVPKLSLSPLGWLAVLHVPNPISGTLALGHEPDPALWPVRRLAAVNVRRVAVSLMALPHLERAKFRRCVFPVKFGFGSKVVQVDVTSRLRLVSESVSESLSLSLFAYQLRNREPGCKLPKTLTVTWSRHDCTELEVDHQDFGNVEDLTLRAYDEEMKYPHFYTLASLRRLCLVFGTLNFSRLPLVIENLGLHHVRLCGPASHRCRVAKVSVRDCTFDPDLMAHSIYYAKDLTLSGDPLSLSLSSRLLSVERVCLVRACHFPESLCVSQLVLVEPWDMSTSNRSHLLASVHAVEIWGVSKAKRREWSELENSHKITFK